jgi:hypothetical protein
MAGDTLHLGPEELDLWLDGRLPSSRTSHLETCEQCRIAAEETSEVVLQLSRLPRAAPTASFADRVMARVQLGGSAARRLGEEHLVPEDLDRWVAGELTGLRVEHLRRCPECQALADAERVLVMRLEALPLFDPKPRFADRVMERVELPITSLTAAWRMWRGRVARDPLTVAVAAGVAVLLGGSLAASAAWAAGNQDTITGAGAWLMSQGQQWFWQAVGLATALLERQPWYSAARAALTPGRLAVLAAGVAALYAGGVMLLRRLLAPPSPEAARALP